MLLPLTTQVFLFLLLLIFALTSSFNLTRADALATRHRNGVIFDQEVVIKPKRTVMCLFPEGGVEAAELVDVDGNEEVRMSQELPDRSGNRSRGEQRSKNIGPFRGERWTVIDAHLWMLL